MIPACINCLYHKGMSCICGNPESEHYNSVTRPVHRCAQWEDEGEYESKLNEYEPWAKLPRRKGD